MIQIFELRVSGVGLFLVDLITRMGIIQLDIFGINKDAFVPVYIRMRILLYYWSISLFPADWLVLDVSWAYDYLQPESDEFLDDTAPDPSRPQKNKILLRKDKIMSNVDCPKIIHGYFALNHWLVGERGILQACNGLNTVMVCCCVTLLSHFSSLSRTNMSLHVYFIRQWSLFLWHSQENIYYQEFIYLAKKKLCYVLCSSFELL